MLWVKAKGVGRCSRSQNRKAGSSGSWVRATGWKLCASGFPTHLQMENIIMVSGGIDTLDTLSLHFYGEGERIAGLHEFNSWSIKILWTAPVALSSPGNAPSRPLDWYSCLVTGHIPSSPLSGISPHFLSHQCSLNICRLDELKMV